MAGGSGAPKYKISGSYLSHISISKYDESTNDYGPETMIYQQYLVTGEDLDKWDCIYRMGDIALSLNQMTPELE